MKIIELRQKGNTIEIKSPYNEDLINKVTEIHYSRRKWDSPCWIVDLEPSEQTDLNTLDYLRQISNETCEQFTGWIVKDFTAKPSDVIVQETEELHHQLLIDVLDKLPNRSLSLIDWVNKSKMGLRNILTIQLDAFLDNPDLFHELKDASLAIARKNFNIYGLGFSEKGDAGRFNFKVLANVEVIQKLAKLNTKYLEIIDCRLLVSFDDNIHHFVDDIGTFYVGFPIEKLDQESVVCSNSGWTLAIVNGQIFFVEKAIDLFDTLCTKSNSVFWIGSIGHPLGSNQGIVTKEFEKYHLLEWLSAHISVLSQGEITVEHWKNSQCKIHDYHHPFDIVSENQSRFSFTDEGTEFVQDTAKRIKEQKEAMVADAIAQKSEEIRRNAIAYTESFTKPELLKFCEKYGIEIKKSWAKSKLATAMVANSNWIEFLIKKQLGV